MLLINECEKCVFFKIYKIVSRSFEKSKISNKSFYRIIYDFIDITTILNKHKWISHVVCFEINFYMIYTHENKKSIIKIFIWIIYTIKTRYKKKIMFIRFDDKRSLNNNWNIYCVFKNIIFKISTIDILIQNDYIEQLNVILFTKFRIMKLETNLFVYL